LKLFRPHPSTKGGGPLPPYRLLYTQTGPPPDRTCSAIQLPTETEAYRVGWFGGFKPPPKFRRCRCSPRSHEQEELASRFPFAFHCVLIRL